MVDNEHTMREYGSQAVVWQTAINPVVALELLDEGVWKGTGVLGPEAFPPEPFLERLAELGSPHGQQELADRARRRWELRRGPASVRARAARVRRRSSEAQKCAGACSTGCSSEPGRGGFGLAREELAEARAARRASARRPSSMPPMPNQIGSVMPEDRL